MSLFDRAMVGWLGVLVVAALGACGSDDDADQAAWQVDAPQGGIVAEVAQLDLAGFADYPAGERLYYRVVRDGREVLSWSPLGVVLDRADFSGALEHRGSNRRRIDERYATVAGKRLERRFRANEMSLRFANAAGDEIELDFRAAPDGVAYRYRILGDGAARALRETSGFRLAAAGDAWLIPYSNPSPFTPAYERHVEKVDIGAVNQDNGWGYAGLFRVGDSGDFAMIAEADLDAEYAGTHLAQPVESLYRIAYPDAGEGLGVGEVEPRSALPWVTPWRVVIVGDLGTVFESTLVDDLSRPLAAVFDGDAGWVRPGRSAWSWFSQNTGTPALQRQYVDFARELGWEYVLVDARWDAWPGGDADLRSTIAYADEAGVRILLWYNSGGSHNVIETETPRDLMNDPATRRAEMARIAELGVAGIKVDFFQSEKQDRIAQYLGILEDAAAERLLVNFHGSTLPRGWARAYPNLVTMEGVRGAEFYRFFDEADAIDNVRLAFTRNVVGSMDYTPVTFRHALAKQAIPYAHQVALAVLFESGVQHFAERADANPDEGFRAVFAQAPFLADFFADVPAVWDESRFIDGTPDSHIVVARRRGEVWYLAAINGLESPLSLDLPLDFAGAEVRSLLVICTADQPDRLALDEMLVEPGERLSIELAAKDGFAAILEP